MRKIQINEQVIVTAIGFRKNLFVYPRRMEFRGTTYNFIDAGLSYLVRHSGRIAEFITISDGSADYYLRSDNHGVNWTLLSIYS